MQTKRKWLSLVATLPHPLADDSLTSHMGDNRVAET